MKKTILAMATLALVASCSSVDVLENGEELKLETRISSKVANNSSSDYVLYARYAEAELVTNWYIRGVDVEGENDTPEHALFWDLKKLPLHLYSYAPKDFANARSEVTATYPNLSIDYVVPTNADEDFTTCVLKNKTTGTANLVFQHMLSKVEFTAVISEELADAGFSIDMTDATVDFTVLKDKSTYTYNPETEDVAVTQGISTLEGTGKYVGAKTYMVLPQDSDGCKIQFKNIKVKKEGGFTYDVNVAESILDGTTPFEIGHSYKIELTFNADIHGEDGEDLFEGIVLDSSVSDWEIPITSW